RRNPKSEFRIPKEELQSTKRDIHAAWRFEAFAKSQPEATSMPRSECAAQGDFSGVSAFGFRACFGLRTFELRISVRLHFFSFSLSPSGLPLRIFLLSSSSRLMAL